MKTKKKRKWWKSVFYLLPGVICMLALGAAFYGVMAYQLAGGEVQAQEQAAGGTLMLEGAQLLSEQTVQERHGGQRCTVLVRRYQLEGGMQAEAVTAQPAAYIERLSEEKWTPQLTTGFTLAGMEAILAARNTPQGEESMLCARQGDSIFVLQVRGTSMQLQQLEQLAGLN